MNSSEVARYNERVLEAALMAVSSATDGSGRYVMIGPRGGTSASHIRKSLIELLAMNRPSPDRADQTVWIGPCGEEAYWRNVELLIKALQAAFVVEGGSKLNQELPG